MQFRDAEQAGTLGFGTPELVPHAIAGRKAAGGTDMPGLARKRVAFVIAHLGPGGAQRVAANAANAFAEQGIDMHIIIANENKCVYRLDSRVTVHASPFGNGQFASSAEGESEAPSTETQGGASAERKQSRLHRLFRKIVPQGSISGSRARPLLYPLFALIFAVDLVRRTLWLRRQIRAIKADAVLAFLTQTNILTVLATRGLNTRTVISERNDPRLQRHRPRVELMRRFVYRRADVVTANSRGALVALESFVPKAKLAFLPNPLSLPASTEIAPLAAPTIITVGRLVEQKGLDVLLAAWAGAVPDLPGWRLAIVGDGPLRDELGALARKLKIEDSVDWHGHVSDPFPLLRASEFFVLTSRFEGTPNALLEAMACGLPGVVSDASPGPCELVGADQSAGLIVPVEDADATAKAMIRLAREDGLRNKLAGGARERAREFESDRALKVWLELLAGT